MGKSGVCPLFNVYFILMHISKYELFLIDVVMSYCDLQIVLQETNRYHSCTFTVPYDDSMQ